MLNLMLEAQVSHAVVRMRRPGPEICDLDPHGLQEPAV